tara:strand:- start:422 stop:541 length:120 start_codon:yes stop_codon:yes gene_type:complete
LIYPTLKDYFQDGSRIGLKISYAQQNSPDEIAEAIIIGE